MDEQWRPVVGYESTYAVSNIGRIMRTATADNSKAGHILTNLLKRGYYQIALCQGGFSKYHFIHKLVAEAFIGRRPTGKQINHKDGNKLNNSPDNLEWVTCAENHAHRRKVLGENNKGTRNGNAKLTEQQVIDIRRLWDERKYS